MATICILTPDPNDEATEGRWPEVFARMAAPLEALGATVEGRPWTDAGDLTGFDLVLPLMVWGNYRAVDAWLAAVQVWEEDGVRLCNPPSVLSWNVDKTYLQRLEEAGAPIAPTFWADQGDAETVEQARAARGWDAVVLKPRRSGGSYRTTRIAAGEAPTFDPFDAPAMIQPYLGSVETSGEVSLIFFEGDFSHAVRKVAASGDFRVQPDFGGHVTAVEPDAEERAAADAALNAIPEGKLLYARIDLVRDLENRLVVMELELLEPDLYLGYDAGAQDRFARAVLDRAAPSSRPEA